MKHLVSTLFSRHAGVQGNSTTLGRPWAFVFGVQSLTLLSCCVTSWNNLNLSEFHRRLLENEALSYRIEVYKYKVLSKELAYRKQLVDVNFLNEGEAGVGKAIALCKEPVKQKLGQIYTNCGVP